MKKNWPVIAYWFFTLWLSLGVISAGIVQVLQLDIEIEMVVNHMGYPVYFLTVLGLSKLLAAVAILAPKWPVLKEWAYAGLVFTMIGAIFSHISVSDGFTDMLPAIFMLVLITLSWYLRPASRKVAALR